MPTVHGSDRLKPAELNLNKAILAGLAKRGAFLPEEALSAKIVLFLVKISMFLHLLKTVIDLNKAIAAKIRLFLAEMPLSVNFFFQQKYFCIILKSKLCRNYAPFSQPLQIIPECFRFSK